jgi:GR25 family glycosyltransferase involved in LPS biosynthesis
MYVKKEASNANELRGGDLHWWHRLSVDQTWVWATPANEPGFEEKHPACVTRTFMQVDGLVQHLVDLPQTEWTSASMIEAGKNDEEIKFYIQLLLESQSADLMQADEKVVSGSSSLRDEDSKDYRARYCPHCWATFPEEECKYCVRYDDEPPVPDAAMQQGMDWLRSKTNFIEEAENKSDKFAGIGPVYVITMGQRKDHVKDYMRALGATANILQAITVEDVDSVSDDDWQVLDVSRMLAPDFDYRQASTDQKKHKVACQLSQLASLRHFLDLDDRPDAAIIMEDDIVTRHGTEDADVEKMVEDFAKNVSNVAKRRTTVGDKGWDVLYLGYCYEPEQSRSYAKSDIGVQPLVHPYCRHAYAITRAGAQVVLDQGLPVQSTGDSMMSRMILSGQLRAFGPVEPFFFQDRDTFGSTLGNSARGQPTAFRTEDRYRDVKLEKSEVTKVLETRFTDWS